MREGIQVMEYDYMLTGFQIWHSVTTFNVAGYPNVP